MRKRAPHVFIWIGLALGLSLVGPQLALSQIAWVRMGVDGMR